MSTERKEINFGLIGLDLMEREFASAVARWCHLLDNGPIPLMTGICARHRESWKWYTDHSPGIKIKSTDYRELLESPEIDAVYCTVPHHPHERFYTDIIQSGKHLFGEKPFGIDLKANENILKVVKENPGIIVRCSSKFPYFPGEQRLIMWVREGNYGRLIDVKASLNHSSDLDLKKCINWKRVVEFNGEYGCRGDLDFHAHYIPFRMGWIPKTVFANLQNITPYRPDKQSGKPLPCETWDNASLVCECINSADQSEFSMLLETKRMSAGSTNDWSMEVNGTDGSAKFSTRDPRSVYFLEVKGKEQGWSRLDISSQSAIPSITGGIFEFGFPDVFQQMLGAFMQEFTGAPEKHPFRTGSPEETYISHRLLSGALESHKTGQKISLDI